MLHLIKIESKEYYNYQHRIKEQSSYQKAYIPIGIIKTETLPIVFLGEKNNLLLFICKT